jgi:aminoglycoside phosphotransferase (APT) family kinase protein
MDDPWGVVAAPRRQAAQDAVAATFGRTPVEAIRPLSGGNSATNFRIDVAGRAYALRLEAQAGGIRDPARTYPCLQAASAAGLSPAVRHLDVAAGVAILDFHTPVPLSQYPGGVPALTAELGRMVARLQAVPGFPAFGRFPDLVRAIFDYVRGSTLFATGLLGAHAEAFETAAAAYPWAAEPRVASHNDINASNLIFDGRRLWLIDWETAFRNDPFADLAGVVVETLQRITGDPAEITDLQEVLLRAWVGGTPGQRERDRLTLMKPLVRIYQASVLLSPFPERLPQGAPFPDVSPMTRAAFRAALAEGRLRPGTPEVSIAYARILLADFMDFCAAPQTKAAMARLAAG